MTRKFNVGDRVRITSNGPLRGTIATVTSVLVSRCPDCGCGMVNNGRRVQVHQLDVPTACQHNGPSCRACVMPQNLEPYYDGNEKVSWSSCVWQPKQVNA